MHTLRHKEVMASIFGHRPIVRGKHGQVKRIYLSVSFSLRNASNVPSSSAVGGDVR